MNKINIKMISLHKKHLHEKINLLDIGKKRDLFVRTYTVDRIISICGETTGNFNV